MIKNIKLFVNNNETSIRLAKLVVNAFIRNDFCVSDDSFDLGIAVGGDGSFIRMVRQCDFDSDINYIGVNAGTLGFLQEANEHEINKLIRAIQTNDYLLDDIFVQETEVACNNREEDIYSLNEIIIRDANLKTAKLDVFIDDNLLETYTGDGLLISTSIGSTGHNLSYGGAIVYGDLTALQINHLAPINSKAYTNLRNSIIIPQCKDITVYPTGFTKDLLLTVDGENQIYENVTHINTSIKDKKIKCLRFKDYNYAQKVNEKLLS